MALWSKINGPAFRSLPLDTWRGPHPLDAAFRPSGAGRRGHASGVCTSAARSTAPSCKGRRTRRPDGINEALCDAPSAFPRMTDDQRYPTRFMTPCGGPHYFRRGPTMSLLHLVSGYLVVVSERAVVCCFTRMAQFNTQRTSAAHTAPGVKYCLIRGRVRRRRTTRSTTSSTR